MKSLIFLSLIFLTGSQAFAKIDSKKSIQVHEDLESSKEITINGMVCAFCSNSLEKKFKKRKSR